VTTDTPGSPLRSHWTLDPQVSFLNHGSFGACPRVVLETQVRLRSRLEAQPVDFMLRQLEPLFDQARADLGSFVGAQPEDLAFVTNATSGVNAVLRSLTFGPGDEILTTDHTYRGCSNALDYVAGRSGARVVVAAVPFPLGAPEEVLQPVLAAAGPRTRLALLDHVTSPTGLIFPITELVAALQARGVDTLVDGAHAPGMVPLHLTGLGAAYYSGNCHKWLCGPKSVGFLHVRRDRQQGIVPGTVSHGLTTPSTGRSRFQLLFDWPGTTDPTPALSVPAALTFLSGLLPGGWPEVFDRNHHLALEGRDLLCRALEVAAPAPDRMLGSMATVPLPARLGPPEALGDRLWKEQRIEVPVFGWPDQTRGWLRVSAQLYNDREEYVRLAEILRLQMARAAT
jgi:isopenicillin-N epimerase